MSIREVTWISRGCLPCDCAGTANVIICTVWGVTVPGQITGPSIAAVACEGTGNRKYEISYDDGDLPAGHTQLATADITGVLCEGCLTFWAREQFHSSIINEQLVAFGNDDATIETTGDADATEYERIVNITNPNVDKDMQVLINWGGALNGSGTNAYNFGVTAELYQDGIVKDSVSSYKSVAANTVAIFTQGFSKAIVLTVPAGTTSEIKMLLTRNVVVEPNAYSFLRHVYLTTFGLV